MRLKPVPTGSTNTRSEASSSESSLSTSRPGGRGAVPSSSSVYAMKNTFARAFSPSLLPSFCASSRSTTVPQVAVYASSRRPIFSRWRLTEIWSVGSGFSGLSVFSRFSAFSAAFSSVSAMALPRAGERRPC